MDSLWPADRGGELLFVLCKQDHHDGRGRNGRDRRCGRCQPHANDVTARLVHRRVGSLRHRRQLGLPNHRSWVQIQPHRYRGSNRRSPVGGGRRYARTPAGDCPPGTLDAMSQVDEIELPIDPDNRIHSWHLFPIRLRLERLSIDRIAFIEALRKDGVGTSVHWRPLHLHPYLRIDVRLVSGALSSGHSRVATPCLAPDFSVNVEGRAEPCGSGGDPDRAAPSL